MTNYMNQTMSPWFWGAGMILLGVVVVLVIVLLAVLIYKALDR